MRVEAQNLETVVSFYPVEPLRAIRERIFLVSQTNPEDRSVWKGAALWQDTESHHLHNHYSPGIRRSREC